MAIFLIVLVAIASGVAFYILAKAMRVTMQALSDNIDGLRQSHSARIDDCLHQIADLQALAKTQDAWVATATTQIATLEQHAYTAYAPVKPERKVLHPCTFSEFKQIVENGVNE